MLIDEYLPVYNFKEFHSIKINGSSNCIYEKMLHCDFRKSSVMKLLSRFKGMSKEFYTIEHITSMGFIKLGEEPDTEILYGTITKSPIFNNCLTFSATDFKMLQDASVIKAVINFHVTKTGNSEYVISTETRVLCGNARLKKRFRNYWFFIKPFSQLIRKHLLRQIKKQILSSK